MRTVVPSSQDRGRYSADPTDTCASGEDNAKGRRFIADFVPDANTHLHQGGGAEVGLMLLADDVSLINVAITAMSSCRGGVQPLEESVIASTRPAASTLSRVSSPDRRRGHCTCRPAHPDARSAVPMVRSIAPGNRCTESVNSPAPPGSGPKRRSASR
jgi:hypothetical protein